MADQGQISMGLNKPCILLIIVSGMERFAFKGVASNLVTYLTDVMKMSNSSAAKYVNSWVGFTSMLPLIVATLADSYWDRYTTILVSSVLYSAAFGADQLENGDDLPLMKTESNKGSDKSKFFQWWYFGICCGCLLGVSVMSYVQDNLGWGLGFSMPTLFMLASILMFLCGNRFYKRKGRGDGNGNSLADIVRPVKAIVSKIVNLRNCPRRIELDLQERASLCNPDQHNDNVTDNVTLVENDEERVHPLQAAKIVLRLLPVWMVLLPFAVIFQQPATFFTKQGMTMRRNIGTDFKIPPAALQSSITVSIVILMPFYDKFFIPLVRIFTRDEKGISVMQRMGIGMFLSVIAMIIAAITEKKRLGLSQSVDLLTGDVPLSIFWLLPQYVLLGISDIFTVVGMQEFFYEEVPVRMRTMGIALYTSVFGVGSFLSAILIWVIEGLTRGEGNWFSDDMSKARLDKYYWFLAISGVISLLGLVAFFKVFKR
ncbi:protein nrt1/ ptr family 5.8 [Phtheirospermum japonicum]|uniref:Protein nrt1/ ptr family 5.8 n=1 Tax=Phtheirospermum japonicum TaxID=374723 RepID=A0A830B853_9LAMI|nr:protein nrt1/ ptr family 5.8 [Phtheirospermum japonicum]